jgi:hypothetical protein
MHKLFRFFFILKSYRCSDSKAKVGSLKRQQFGINESFLPHPPNKMTQDDPAQSTEQKDDATFSAKMVPCILIMIIGIFVLLLVDLTVIVKALNWARPASHPAKEDSVVEVIGRYQDGDIPGVTWSNLLVSDAGQLKLIKYDKGSRLDIMSPPPKYLIQSWANNQVTYTPILAKLVRPAYDEGYYDYGYGTSYSYEGYFDNGYGYDKPGENPVEEKK